MNRFKRSAAAYCLFFLITSLSCFADEPVVIGPGLEILPLAENVWLHTSYIEIDPWGMVGANGLAVITDGKLIIIDTPWNDGMTIRLVQWFERNLPVEEVVAIVTHYHSDNLGGLNWIHRRGFDSYGLGRTREICREKRLPIPTLTLTGRDRLDFDEIPLEIFFPGPGHTEDSLAVYLPKQKILFGGCSIKSAGNRSLGNTADADIGAWPASLRRTKARFPEAVMVVPGHGGVGGVDLIDHTLSLFD